MKNEDYYINECSSKTQIGREYTKYGYKNDYAVEDKTVSLYFNQFANGPDDYYDELIQVEIKDKKSLLQKLKEAVDLNPMSFLGK